MANPRGCRLLAAASIAIGVTASSAQACSLVGGWDVSPMAGAVRLKLRALPDTLAVGGGVFGQLMNVEDFVEDSVGPAFRGALRRSGERVLLVPHSYGADCRDIPWTQSARWIVPDSAAILVAAPVATELWISGIPTFRVLANHRPYPHGYRIHPGGPASPVIPVAVYWELLSVLPSPTATSLEIEAARQSAREWLSRYPELARRYPAPAVLWSLIPP